MSDPLVSVLIPCYNAEKYVGETLDSVLAQTWRNLEIIVVDDGSTDGSAAVVARYADRGVQLIRQSNRGQTAALNMCLQHATGEYVQYLDADDLIGPDKIAVQMARLLDEPACVASCEWGRFYGEAAQISFEYESNWCDLDPVEWLTRSRESGLGMLFPALWLVPRSVADRAGPWDDTLSLGDDGEYYTRVVLAAERVLFCAGARCRYRSGNPGSLSGSKNWASSLRVLELCEAYVRAREDSDRVRRGFALSWQHLAHAAYPYEPMLAERALARAQHLHDVRVLPGGGVRFKILSRLLGWRLARRLQVLSGRS
jgi:glycosyltransferase involved in cell wall biosynthesis